MDGQIFTLELAAPEKHGHQADPGKDKKKTRRAEAAGLRSAPRCERGPEPAPIIPHRAASLDPLTNR
jgi:hypothetical protein